MTTFCRNEQLLFGLKSESRVPRARLCLFVAAGDAIAAPIDPQMSFFVLLS
jgi:hypothetical protein